VCVCVCVSVYVCVCVCVRACVCVCVEGSPVEIQAPNSMEPDGPLHECYRPVQFLRQPSVT